MKILLLGKNGQVGWELQRSLSVLGELTSYDLDVVDFTDLNQVSEIVRQVNPDVIVNAAAHTAVDRAESEPELVHKINALAPGALAKEAAQISALLVHYSTDYVFDGSGNQPWTETDMTGPLSVYGASKLAAERLIAESGCKHLIFRTSWVYGARGGNFAKTMLRFFAERDIMKVIDDQIGAPTGADLLADVTAHAILATQRDSGLCGLYHLVAAGQTSWHGYASVVLDYARRAGVELKVQTIEAVPTTAFPTPAKRPLNSRLNTQKLQTAFNLQLPHWKTGVERMLAEIMEKK